MTTANSTPTDTLARLTDGAKLVDAVNIGGRTITVYAMRDMRLVQRDAVQLAATHLSNIRPVSRSISSVLK